MCRRVRNRLSLPFLATQSDSFDEGAVMANANSAATSFGFSKMEVRVRVFFVGKEVLGRMIGWMEEMSGKPPPSEAKSDS
jgi:hypothetical protein